jgi:cytochrome P450
VALIPGDARTTRSVERFSNRTLKYLPGELLSAMYRWHGSVTVIGPYACLLGSEANRFILANPELFRWREAFRAFIPVNGETALIVSDGAAHRRMRRLMQPSFHHRQVENYLAIVAENADAVIDAWRPGQRIDVDQAFRSAIRRSTIHSLFGRQLARDTRFFTEQLREPLNLVRSGVPQIVTWKRRLFTPLWRRSMAALRRVDARVYAEIGRARRNGADVGDNLLAALVHGVDDSGEALSDREIRDQVVNLISADETTHPVMAWAIYGMLTTPGVWERAAAEVRNILGDRWPAAEDLKRLTYLNGVVQETLRLYPPSAVSLRYVAQDFEFAGRRIKRGKIVVVSPYVTHRLSELWSEPLAFRPQRWDPTDPGYRKRRTDEYLPFGAGPHRCIGAELAVMELTVMLARLLARTSLRLPEQLIRLVILPVMQPVHGLRVDILG